MSAPIAARGESRPLGDLRSGLVLLASRVEQRSDALRGRGLAIQTRFALSSWQFLEVDGRMEDGVVRAWAGTTGELGHTLDILAPGTYMAARTSDRSPNYLWVACDGLWLGVARRAPTGPSPSS